MNIQVNFAVGSFLQQLLAKFYLQRWVWWWVLIKITTLLLLMGKALINLPIAAALSPIVCGNNVSTSWLNVVLLVTLLYILLLQMLARGKA